MEVEELKTISDEELLDSVIDSVVLYRAGYAFEDTLTEIFIKKAEILKRMKDKQ